MCKCLIVLLMSTTIIARRLSLRVVQGGLPAWLLSDNVTMIVRSMDQSEFRSCSI